VNAREGCSYTSVLFVCECTIEFTATRDKMCHAVHPSLLLISGEAMKL